MHLNTYSEINYPLKKTVSHFVHIEKVRVNAKARVTFLFSTVVNGNNAFQKDWLDTSWLAWMKLCWVPYWYCVSSAADTKPGVQIWKADGLCDNENQSMHFWNWWREWLKVFENRHLKRACCFGHAGSEKKTITRAEVCIFTEKALKEFAKNVAGRKDMMTKQKHDANTWAFENYSELRKVWERCWAKRKVETVWGGLESDVYTQKIIGSLMVVGDTSVVVFDDDQCDNDGLAVEMDSHLSSPAGDIRYVSVYPVIVSCKAAIYPEHQAS